MSVMKMNRQYKCLWCHTDLILVPGRGGRMREYCPKCENEPKPKEKFGGPGLTDEEIEEMLDE